MNRVIGCGILALWFANLGVPHAMGDIVEDGLIHWYRGENNANDSIGGVDGSFVGDATYQPGVFGSAFELNGNNLVQMESGVPVIPTTGDFSIALWFNDFGGDNVREFVSQRGLNNNIYLGTNRQNGADTFRASDDWIDTGVKTLPNSGWHHIALTRITNEFPNTTRLYLDGQLEAELFSPIGSPHSILGNRFRIGAQFTGFEKFIGLIDEVAIYNRGLSHSEVQQLATVPEPAAVHFVLMALGVVAISTRRNRKR